MEVNDEDKDSDIEERGHSPALFSTANQPLWRTTKSGATSAGSCQTAVCVAKLHSSQKNGGFPMFRLMKVALSAAIAMLAALVAQPSMAAVVTNSTTPMNSSFINPCNGHPTIFAGLLHVVASTTFDGSGFQTKLHLNEEQGRDTDQVTGVVCTDTGVFNWQGHNFDVFSGTVGGLPLEITATNTGLESCPGSMGNFRLHAIAHVTVNPNGIVTVNFDGFPATAECLGP